MNFKSPIDVYRMEQLFLQTLEEMPDIFTSNLFCYTAKQKGVYKRDIADGQAATFLSSHAKQYGSKRRWIKLGYIVNQANVKPTLNIEEAISLLKNAGYKVMKPKTEWEEL